MFKLRTAVKLFAIKLFIKVLYYQILRLVMKFKKIRNVEITSINFSKRLHSLYGLSAWTLTVYPVRRIEADSQIKFRAEEVNQRPGGKSWVC